MASPSIKKAHHCYDKDRSLQNSSECKRRDKNMRFCKKILQTVTKRSRVSKSDKQLLQGLKEMTHLFALCSEVMPVMGIGSCHQGYSFNNLDPFRF